MRHSRSLRSRAPRLGAAALVLALALCALVGCSVIEEIDKIGKDDSPEPAPKSEAAAPASGSSSAQQKLQAYYDRKPGKAAPEDPDNPIVRCRVRGTDQFLRKYDCELRNGRIKS